MTPNHAHTKLRILLASVLSTIVLISSVYNVTATFTRKMVQEIIILEESRQLEIASKLLLAGDLQKGNYGLTDTLHPCQENKKVYHASAERTIDKRRVKKNEIESWKDMEIALSKHLDSNETTVSADKTKKTVKTKSHPKQRRTKSTKATQKQIKASAATSSSDTTIVITTNWMPSLPSTVQLDKVINSLSFLRGLAKDTPMVIAVDGAYETGGRHESGRNVDLRAYIQAIRRNYQTAPRIQIMTSSKKIMLVQNMKRALQKVDTQFVLVLQHDLPFINEVNYTGLMETMESHSQEVRLVRFPTARVLTRKRDGGVCQTVDFVDSKNGIQLTKTHVWSDR